VAQDFGQYDGLGDARGLQTGDWDQTGLDIVSYITAVPQPDAAFDAILCIEVFEHLPDPVAALREFSRLIRPGGELILTAPFCSLTHFAPYHFYSGFNSYFYEKYLPEFGFEIKEIKNNGNFFEYLAQEVRRLPTMSRRFAGNRMQRCIRFAMHPLLVILGVLAKHDSGSDETLCFGFHVHAVKKG
jgi:ubiquinone/menaquinone biosynthesis C-methylase UbiE